MKDQSLRYLAIISLLTLIAFAVRAVSLDEQSFWRDEVDALCYAFQFPHLTARALAPEAFQGPAAPFVCPPPLVPVSALSSEGKLLRLIEMFGRMTRHNGPLYYFLLRGWIALAGTSEYAARFLPLIFGVLCVPLVYVLGQRLFDRPTGLLTALLVTASPYLVWYSQEAKMYTLVSALALAAIYALRRAVEGAGWHWWVMQVIATSLAPYTHILAALLIPVQILLCLIWLPQARRQWIGALVSLACLTLPYLPLIAWQVERVPMELETGFYPYTLSEMAQILLNVWSGGLASWGQPWGAALLSGLAVWGLLSSLARTSRAKFLAGGQGTRNRLALTGWLVPPLLTVWLISLRQPLFTDRYLIWTALPFYLLVAVGLASLRRFESWGSWASACLAVAILVLNDGPNLWRQATIPMKADFRAVVAHVADYGPSDAFVVSPTSAGPTNDEHPFTYYLPLIMASAPLPDQLIIFQIPHGRYAFDYYFKKKEGKKGYAWAKGLYTNYRNPDGSYQMSEQEAVRQMQEMTAEYEAIWLIATETPTWDERGLVQAWLEANAQRVDEAHFEYIDVFRYLK
jgi:uncharacterized membrane protein